jgi:hypothetical protein
MNGNTEAAILGRLIEPEKSDRPPEAARFLLRLDFTPGDKARMDELAAKAREGAIDADDRAELENYVHVGHLLALMQSKARNSLKRGGFAA